MHNLGFVLITLLNIFVKCQTEAILSLSGNDWIATNFNKSIKVQSHVPGGIYTDLLKSGVLKEDPYIGNNDIAYRWIGRDNWTFNGTFKVESSLINKKSIFLICHGIDTVSKIYINDALIGTTENMFVRYKFDIKNHLKIGNNYIKVSIESAVEYVKVKHAEYSKEKHYSVPPYFCKPPKFGECFVNYIRKMQASFSWDWGPSFPSQGIWKNIEIQAYDTGIIRDVTVDTVLDNHNHWTLNTNVHLEFAHKEDFDIRLEIHLQNFTIYAKDMTIKPENDGTFKLQLKIQINDTIKINQWWPNEVSIGTQTLYDLKVHLISKNVKEDSTKIIKIGFRTIELIQNPIKPSGLTFYFKVNGVPFFVKGANWIPAEVFPELLTEEYIRDLLQSAKDAHMNMLRIWGGGIYESDKFYEIADEMGIMIWHDFMFASALYPTDDAFMHSVSTEITQQIRRLQHHPSIAIWSGNNENENVLVAFFLPKDPHKYNESQLYRDYVKLTVDTQYAILKKEDTSRPFVPSCNSNGRETEREHWVSKNPQDTRYGDVHFYLFGFNHWDWKVFPSPKFASEYGFQSYPSIETWSKVTKLSDWTYPISAAVEHRQHQNNGGKLIEGVIGNYMKLPSHGGAERFKDLIYLSQIGQAMAMKTETEFYRRNREIDPKNGNGYTMGALYWMLNDIWQCPSWSSIEYGGKWKMLQYYAKHMFSNLLLSPYEDHGEILKVSIVRDDSLGPLKFSLTLKIYKWSSLTPSKIERFDVHTNSFSSNNVFNHSIPEILKSANCSHRDECIIFIEIENSNHKMIANNFLLLGSLKNAIGMTKPHLIVSKVKGPLNLPNSMHEYDIEIETNVVTPYVWIDFIEHANIKGKFSDNGFVMFNNHITVKLYSKSSVSSDVLKSKLSLKSLTDIQ